MVSWLGFEPLTSRSRGGRSTTWAIRPDNDSRWPIYSYNYYQTHEMTHLQLQLLSYTWDDPSIFTVIKHMRWPIYSYSYQTHEMTHLHLQLLNTPTFTFRPRSMYRPKCTELYVHSTLTCCHRSYFYFISVLSVYDFKSVLWHSTHLNGLHATHCWVRTFKHYWFCFTKILNNNFNVCDRTVSTSVSCMPFVSGILLSSHSRDTYCIRFMSNEHAT
jgi:hypothetical protein